ncbi:uncharacterized protein LOC122853780 [Aphidius gifuensis]|uniref:uncharacterized protein LOC122853780 n=1 Tax=Aphidius gifuensis TaxID=684658 RepID=UPI001CDC69C2|nr:uncharacterized protein LOC122853780 [Aphidius gifuensis]
MSCSIFIILLLCCTWIVFGEGVVINGKREGTTLLPVIPSNTIYCDPREYVTVSLNVEYRNDTTCKIEEATNDLFQRVGACSFRGLANKIKIALWTIVAETKLSHQYKGTFQVLTFHSETTKIYFYKETHSVIPLDVFDREYCNIVRPNEKNNNNLKIKNIRNSEYVIDEKEKYSGEWIVQYFNSTNQNYISKIYDVTFKEKIKPGMVVTTIKNSKNSGTWSKFECRVDFASIGQCSFHGPSGIIINEGIDNNSKKFDYEVINTRASGHPKCVLTIYNQTMHEEGQWKCSLRDENQIANGTKIIGDRFKKLTVNVFQKIGSDFDLNCTQNHEWKYCDIEHPNGERTSKIFNNSPIPNVKEEDKICSKKFKNANKQLNGNWTCTVSRDVESMIYEKTYIVRVTEDFALADLRYEDVAGINKTILEARPFPTDENKMKNITNCAWTHPLDKNYLSNDSYYTMTNNNNICKLIINYPQEYDKGNWTCSMTLKSSNGALNIFFAVFDLQDVEIYNPTLWWYILHGSIAVSFLIIAISIVWWDIVTAESRTKLFDAENEQQQQKHYKD